MFWNPIKSQVSFELQPSSLSQLETLADCVPVALKRSTPHPAPVISCSRTPPLPCLFVGGGRGCPFPEWTGCSDP